MGPEPPLSRSAFSRLLAPTSPPTVPSSAPRSTLAEAAPVVRAASLSRALASALTMTKSIQRSASGCRTVSCPRAQFFRFCLPPDFNFFFFGLVMHFIYKLLAILKDMQQE